MLARSKILQILNSFNIYSQKYETTIYENNQDLGLCLDIKDSLFGYLTRLFLFSEEQEITNFLKGYFWYKENHEKYQISLCLDAYDTKTPKLIYKYKNQPLALENMLNMEEYLNTTKKAKEEELEKNIYLANIRELTTYLSNLRQQKENIKQEKNKLKTTENDLKFQLLQELTVYYGKEKPLTKRPISIDPPKQPDNTLIQNNLKNIETKDLVEIKNYLSSLIAGIKQEELEDKYLVNLYSNQVYKYNINILQKQIEFVKSKITAEKKFNLKGSKIHNIDEELKSFLKSDNSPVKLEVFLNDLRNQIATKYESITDLKNAASILTKKDLSVSPVNQSSPNEELTSPSFNEAFNSLDDFTKVNLILYNSIYKPICNYIIDNNYPDILTIQSAFDFHHYYTELEEIIYHENNNHYLNTYFKHLDFKDLTSYIESLVNICKVVEKTKFPLNKSITLFNVPSSNKYKHLTEYPGIASKYLLNVSQPLLFIPYKLDIDWETLEINLLTTKDYYTSDKIITEEKKIVLTKYSKQQTQKDGIIITTDLILDQNFTFIEGHIEGDNHG